MVTGVEIDMSKQVGFSIPDNVTGHFLNNMIRIRVGQKAIHILHSNLN